MTTRLDPLIAAGDRVAAELEQAGITMRNYFAGAISRAYVDAQLQTIRETVAEWTAARALMSGDAPREEATK